MTSSSAPKPPTRVGLIGLSTNSTSSWAETAHLPYLLSSPLYTITALCNSSPAAARAAVSHYNLPTTTKAYGSVADLARDPEVDLIVVSVAVGKHYAVARQVLDAGGKDLYVEWPVGVDVQQARELAELARRRGVRTLAGAQTRASPAVVALRGVLEGARVGRVTSTSVVADLGPQAALWPAVAGYYFDLRSGGNNLTIRFGHFLGVFLNLIGPFRTHHSILHTTYPDAKLVDAELPAIMRNELTAAQLEAAKPAKRTAPDEILLHGTLASGAVASIVYRATGRAERLNDVAFRWLITGTEGEIEVTQSFAPAYMHKSDCKIAVLGKDGLKEEVQIDWEMEGRFKVYGQNTTGANIGRLYDAFARGDDKVCMDFEQAVGVHELLDAMIDEHERQAR